MIRLGADNGRFLRHRFSPKSTSVATQISLPKRNRVAKEAVSAARQTKRCHRSEQHGKPNDSPTTKPRPCVKTMLCDRSHQVEADHTEQPTGTSSQVNRFGNTIAKVDIGCIDSSRPERISTELTVAESSEPSLRFTMMESPASSISPSIEGSGTTTKPRPWRTKLCFTVNSSCDISLI